MDQLITITNSVMMKELDDSLCLTSRAGVPSGDP